MNSPETPEIPGGVYLCQVSPSTSCGACCGLYNTADASRHHLQAMLSYRTDLFARTPRDENGIYDFQKTIERRDRRRRPFPNFHHCPFIGLVGAGRQRVGCLLHPSSDGNNGVDFRGLSWYGGLACRTYFCSAYRRLPARYKQIVLDLSPDWYLYGLVITEVDMLVNFFGAVEERLGGQLLPAAVAHDPDWQGAVCAFFELKITWPFRSAGSAGPANYFFEDGQYPTAPVAYAHTGATTSTYDEIFRALGSVFESRRALKAAEGMIDLLLARFAPPDCNSKFGSSTGRF